MTVTYTLTDKVGTETITLIQYSDEVRQITATDGETVDDTIVFNGYEVDEYLRRRDIDLTNDGYTKA